MSRDHSLLSEKLAGIFLHRVFSFKTQKAFIAFSLYTATHYYPPKSLQFISDKFIRRLRLSCHGDVLSSRSLSSGAPRLVALPVVLSSELSSLFRCWVREVIEFHYHVNTGRVGLAFMFISTLCDMCGENTVTHSVIFNKILMGLFSTILSFDLFLVFLKKNLDSFDLWI